MTIQAAIKLIRSFCMAVKPINGEAHEHVHMSPYSAAKRTELRCGTREEIVRPDLRLVK